MTEGRGRRSFLALTGSLALAAVVGQAGCAVDGEPVSANRQPTPVAEPAGSPSPADTSAPPKAETSKVTELSTGPARSSPVMSPPTRLDIPDIGVSTGVMSLGLQHDGTIEVPPFDRADEAGWYVNSPMPGQVGPVIIVGHIDSPNGPAVFYRLAGVSEGQSVRLTCKDGRTVTYRIERVQLFPKAEFPTDLVYGNLTYPGVRLITCGGPYQRSAGGYQGNTVVFGRIDSE